MSALPKNLPAILSAQRPVPSPLSSRAAWELPVFAGRLGELCGGQSSAVLTLAFRLVLDAQRRNEPVAWITRQEKTFYPPDVADTAVDVEALAVIRAGNFLAGARAADWLLRSGGFGLVILDLGGKPRFSLAILGRLSGLAQKHQAAVLCLTRGEHLGSLVSIRAEATRRPEEEERYPCEVRILKDKRHGPGWEHREICRGPHGLH
jgi:recombination protein RecA